MKRMPHLLLPRVGTRGLQDPKRRGSKGDLGSGETEPRREELPAQLPQQTPREEKGATRPRADGEDPTERQEMQGNMEVGELGVGSPRTWQMASGQRSWQWIPSPRLVKCPPLRLPGSPLHPASLWRWANSAGSQAGQQASRTFFWRGARPFFSRVQDSGTKEPKSLILFRT